MLEHPIEEKQKDEKEYLQISVVKLGLIGAVPSELSSIQLLAL